MKVLYDHQMFTWQKFGGISRYFCELMKNSKGLFEYDVSGVFFENEYIKRLGLYRNFPIKINFKGKNRLVYFFNKKKSIKKIKKGSYDIIHPTYYDPYVLKITNDVPITIDEPDKIFKKTIVPLYEVTNVNNTVIPEGNIYQKNIVSIRNLKQEYILFTGQRSGYKNFERFVEAVAPLLMRYDLQLICTGNSFTKRETAFLHEHKIANRTISKFVSENKLKEIYANALLFVFPSLYEGFGFPILEAFSSGCPVVLSNTSCFPEIAADAAVYFDPYSITDIRQKVETVLLDASFQLTLIKKGFKRAADFSWEKSTRQTYQLYSKALSLSSPRKVRLIITVHDMIHEFFPEHFPYRDKTSTKKYTMIQNADKIIAISHNTKVDILKLYPKIDENKIEVIYHGTSFDVKDTQI